MDRGEPSVWPATDGFDFAIGFKSTKFVRPERYKSKAASVLGNAATRYAYQYKCA